MQVIIVGARRSGTTVFWRTLRQDSRFLCFDEPFNPLLRELPRENIKGTRRELIGIYARDPHDFQKRFSPIFREEELRCGLNREQKAYLKYLLTRAPHIILDTTRCHFKLEALAEAAPDALLVHLHRSPASFATSHLLPQERSSLTALRHWRRRMTFWWRKHDFGGWGLEELIDGRHRQMFRKRLQQASYPSDKILRGTAVTKTLAYWALLYRHVEHEGPRRFPGRFLSVAYEDFCREPQDVLGQIYDFGNLERYRASTSGVHPPKLPYAPSSPRWLRAATEAGIPEGSFLSMIDDRRNYSF